MVDGVGRGGHRGDRNAGAVGELGTLHAALGPVHRVGAGAFTTAGRLGGAAVHGEVREVQADRLVIGVQAGQLQPVPHAQVDPLVAAAAHRRRRARRVGDAFIADAEHQRLDQLVEHDALIDAPSVTAQRMLIDVRWQQREELLAQGLKDARWDGRHERSTSHGALAPLRAWPSCLPSPISHVERRDQAYRRGLLRSRVAAITGALSGVDTVATSALRPFTPV
jgi:hypothetical protein